MKKLTKMLFLTGLLGLIGCSNTGLTEEELIIEEIETGSQKTSFFLTDAPSDNFKSVRVDIISPIIVRTDTGDVNVPLPDGQTILGVDLLALNGVSDLLTSHPMPAGTIRAITLNLLNPEIVLLDGTRYASEIDFTSAWTLTPPLTAVSEKQGGAIEIDMDVEKSVTLDTRGTPIFRPQGSVRFLGKTDPGIEVAQITGTVAEIPGMKGQSRSFLLRHSERRFFVAVDTSAAIVYNPAETDFTAIAKGQPVRVSGVFTGDGVLKARRVFIVPEDHQIVRGVITNLQQADLNAHTFLLSLPERDSLASRTMNVVYNQETTHIRLERPDRPMQTSDLTNGQEVTLQGSMNRPGMLDVRVIVVHPERFLGFVAREKECTGLPQHFNLSLPPRLLYRLGIENKNSVGRIEIGGKIVNVQGREISCGQLNPGTAVTIFGYMRPPLPNAPIRVKALEVLEAVVTD